MEPGDVIIQFNGRPIKNNDELVRMVVATKPGTSVPVKVLRNKLEKTLNVTVDELDLDAEQNTTRRSPDTDQQPPEEHGAGGFGLTLENVTPQLSRRLRLPSGQSGAIVSDVDPDGPSAPAAPSGRRDPVGELESRVERGRGGARAAEDRGGSHRADARVARRWRSLRPRQEGIAGISDCRLQIADCGCDPGTRPPDGGRVHGSRALRFRVRLLRPRGPAIRPRGRFFYQRRRRPPLRRAARNPARRDGRHSQFRISDYRFRSRGGRRGERSSLGRHPARGAGPRSGVLRVDSAASRRGERRSARRAARHARRYGRSARLVGRRVARVVRGRPARERAARRAPGAPGGHACQRSPRGVRQILPPGVRPGTDPGQTRDRPGQTGVRPGSDPGLASRGGSPVDAGARGLSRPAGRDARAWLAGRDQSARG